MIWILKSLKAGIPGFADVVRTVFTDERTTADVIKAGLHPGVRHRICTWHMLHANNLPDDYAVALKRAVGCKTREEFEEVMKEIEPSLLLRPDWHEHYKRKCGNPEIWAGYALRDLMTLGHNVSPLAICLISLLSCLPISPSISKC
jgi:hypothetical protein